MNMKFINFNFPSVTFSLLYFLCAFHTKAQDGQGRIVMDLNRYPLVFELNAGETHAVKRSYG